MGDLRSLSRCCALYSAVGLIFMVWIGIMLIHQPFFIAGIEDVASAKNSAFGAAGTFFLTFLVSIIYLISDNRYGLSDMNMNTLSSALRNNMSTSGTGGIRPPRRNQYGLVSSTQQDRHSGEEDDEDDYHDEDLHETVPFT